MLIMLSLDCGWIVTSEGRVWFCPTRLFCLAAFILVLRGTVATKGGFCNVLHTQSLFVKPGLLFLPLLAHRENGLTEIQRVTLQPCWYE